MPPKKIYSKTETKMQTKKLKELERKPKSTKKEKRKTSTSKNKSLFSEENKDSKKVFDKITIVMTGVFRNFKDRNELGEKLKELGARVTGSVSGVTDVLIHGYELEDKRPFEESRKYKTAQLKGTLIFSEEDFLKEYKNKTGKSLIDNRSKELDYENFAKNKKKENSENKLVFKTSSNSKKIEEEISKKVSKNPLKKNMNQETDDFDKVNYKANQLWVDEFKPKSSSDLIGNKKIISNLRNWLQKYYTHEKNTKKSQKEKSKAVLLSGCPGIGKTSAAKIIAIETGFDCVIKNASDIRNKNSINSLLDVLNDNLVLSNYYQKNNVSSMRQKNNKCVIIMDEVDGMTGDRGGLTALINQIKSTKQPIICICNERSSKNIQKLAPHCYDLKFENPTIQEIFILLKYVITNKYSLDFWDSLDKSVLSDVILNSNYDIRQIITFLETWLSRENVIKKNNHGGFKDKDLMMNVFEATKNILNTKFGPETNYNKLEKWFFIDYNMIDMFIFENYLSKICSPNTTSGINRGSDKKRLLLEQIDLSLDSMAIGDRISKNIRKNRDYSLLRTFAFFSTFCPSLYFNRVCTFTMFPLFFGKLSAYNKKKRLLNELRDAFAIRNNLLGNDMVLCYMKVLAQIIELNLNSSRFAQNYKLYLNYDLTPFIIDENFGNFIEFVSNNNSSINSLKKEKKKFNTFFNSKVSVKIKKTLNNKKKKTNSKNKSESKINLSKEEDSFENENSLEEFIIDDY